MRNPSSRSSARSRSTPTPCCGKVGIKRGPWTPEEDEILAGYIKKDGEGRWRTLPKRAGLLRCGKSCRLRWMNYLRPSVKRGRIAPDEEDLILRLHRLLGNRWSLIAGRIPGRTDNEIKNYWNTHLSKKLISQGIDPKTHKPLYPNPNSSEISNIPPIQNTNHSSFPKNYWNTHLSKKLISQGTDPKTHKPLYPNPNSSEISNIPPVQNSNPSSFLLEENARLDRAIATIVIENFTMTNLDQFPNQVIDDGAENRPSGDGSNKGLLQSHHHEQNEEEDCTGYENEDTFSLFLDSLINENVFMYQEQQQLQQPNIPVPSGEPVISSSQASYSSWQ